MRYSVALVSLVLAPSLAAQDVDSLIVSEAVERTIEPGQTHTYSLELEADWFISGRADQDGADVTVAVIGPEDLRVGRFDSPNGERGAEPFQFSTESDGEYRIDITVDDDGEAGRYSIRLLRSEPVATAPESRVDQLMTMFGEDTPGAVVGVVRDGGLVFPRAYGSANLTHGIPFEVDTRTNIGSTSKQFTAFALSLLEDRGLLSLDDDVKEHIPELPDFGERVTLRNLLTHTSGYRELYHTLALTGRQLLTDEITRDEVLEILHRQPELQNSPGAEYNYNNTAFALAAMVVERVGGLPFGEWMRQEVFGPLGMENTVIRSNPGEIVPGAAAGYVVAEGGFRDTRDLGAAMGAGTIYTTVADLARWVRNFQTAELGSPEIIEAMMTPFLLNDGEETSYGLGLVIDEDRGLKRVQHGGADNAHRSTFVYYPDLDAAYLLLSNLGSTMPGSLAPEVAEAFFGEHMSEPETAAADSNARANADPDDFDPEDFDLEIFDAYAGRYELEEQPGFVLTFWREDDRLLAQATGQQEFELRPLSDSTFAIVVVDAQLTFHRETDGSVRSLTLHQNGDQTAHRLADAEDVDLDVFVGRYFSEELQTFYDLEVQEGELVVRHRRFGPITLTHTEDDRFTGTFPIGDLAFERDDSGQVTGFRVGNGRTRDVRFDSWD